MTVAAEEDGKDSINFTLRWKLLIWLYLLNLSSRLQRNGMDKKAEIQKHSREIPKASTRTTYLRVSEDKSQVYHISNHTSKIRNRRVYMYFRHAEEAQRFRYRIHNSFRS